MLMRDQDTRSAGARLVQHCAARVRRQLGALVDYDDLVAFGWIGLLEAEAAFDPRRGEAVFSSFAHRRVIGAMMDGVRKMEPLGRRRTFLRTMRHDPGDVTQFEKPDVAGLSNIIGWRACQFLVAAAAAQAENLNPEEAMEHKEQEELARARLARLPLELRKLPDKQRSLIERHFYGDEPFTKIIAELGASQSAVSHAHRRARQALHDAIEQTLHSSEPSEHPTAVPCATVDHAP
jgi:RNA polymerase sigma factor for flagellar operon FliA